MTTKLEAINTMLSCVGQSPINTLTGTKSYYVITAEQILEQECKRVQLTGWDFNTDEHYALTPDVNNTINITDDMLLVKCPQMLRNRYVVRGSKLYDKLDQTFEIRKPIYATVIWQYEFEKLPENFRTFITISSAYKFAKRVLGSEMTCMFTREDVIEAYNDLLGYELETGNYSIIPEMSDRTIRGEL